MLDGKSYPMLPTLAATQAIESQLGPILALTARLADRTRRLSVAEIALVVTETIRAAGKDRDDKMLQGVQAERIADLIFDEGIVSVIDSVQILLINMISGGGKAKKKQSGGKKKTESITGD